MYFYVVLWNSRVFLRVFRAFSLKDLGQRPFTVEHETKTPLEALQKHQQAEQMAKKPGYLGMI